MIEVDRGGVDAEALGEREAVAWNSGCCGLSGVDFGRAGERGVDGRRCTFRDKGDDENRR